MRTGLEIQGFNEGKAHERNWKLGKVGRDLDWLTSVTWRESEEEGGHVTSKDSSVSVGGSVRLRKL